MGDAGLIAEPGVCAGREQSAIETPHLRFEGDAETAGVHGAPPLADEGDDEARVVVAAVQKIGKCGFRRQQAHGLRKHAEDGAHQKNGDGVGRVPLGFECLGKFGEQGCNAARDGDAPALRVERVRLGPDGAQPLADFGVGQIGEIDAEGCGVRKLRVMFAGAGEIGIEIEAEADVADDQEWRPSLLGRQVTGVGLSLAAGSEHGLRPLAALPDVGTPILLLLAEQCQLRLVGALLGFEHEAAALI